MRRTLIALLAVAAGVGGWFGRRAFSDDGKAGGAMPSEEEMEKMMEVLAKPGDMHRWLAASEGTWDVTAKHYDMKGAVTESKGSATIKMILGGRWQEQTYSGSYKGKPFDGFGLTGYDNAKKEFVGYWFDSMGTSAGVSTGQASEDRKTLTMAGSWEMPGMKMTYRTTLTVKSEKEMVFSVSGSMGGGKEFPMMELAYTRK